MAASTITRTTWTNDTGTPASPVGDGTLINNARLQDIYAAIDQLFGGAGSYATLTLAGKLAVEGFGTSSFTSSGAGEQILRVRNTSSGSSSMAKVAVGNDADADAVTLRAYSTTFTGAVSQGQLVSSIAGGLIIAAGHASGALAFNTAGTIRLTVSSAGLFTFSSASVAVLPLESGSSSAPSLSFSVDADTGFYRSGSNKIGVAAAGVMAYEFGTIGVSASRSFSMPSQAFGTGGVSGCGVYIGRNSSGSGAAGFLNLETLSGSQGYYWQDNSGNFRVHTAAPTDSGGDTSGTVVGTQTSLRETKQRISAFLDHSGALDLIKRTPLYRFQYREFDPETRHVGIMADESPEFTRYNQTVFDPINAFGYTAAAIKALLGRVESLEAALAAGRQG